LIGYSQNLAKKQGLIHFNVTKLDKKNGKELEEGEKTQKITLICATRQIVD